MEQDLIPIILGIHTKSTAEHPRYVISDGDSNYWTGTSWSPDEDEAFLYHALPDAATDIHKLLMLQYGNLPRKRFVAPIYIDLYSENTVDLNVLKLWLHRISRLLMKSEQHGNGPLNGTLGLCHIDWKKLKEVKS